MEEWISKKNVLKLIDEHSDMFDSYTDQQTFKDLLRALPTAITPEPIYPKNGLAIQVNDIDVNGQPIVQL